jgi:hypothetical protein
MQIMPQEINAATAYAVDVLVRFGHSERIEPMEASLGCLYQLVRLNQTRQASNVAFPGRGRVTRKQEQGHKLWGNGDER